MNVKVIQSVIVIELHFDMNFKNELMNCKEGVKKFQKVGWNSEKKKKIFKVFFGGIYTFFFSFWVSLLFFFLLFIH